MLNWQEEPDNKQKAGALRSSLGFMVLLYRVEQLCFLHRRAGEGFDPFNDSLRVYLRHALL